MKKRTGLRTLVWVTICSSILYSCDRTITSQDRNPETRGRVSTGPSSDIKGSGNFILIANSSTGLPSGIDASIAAIGGTVTRKLDAIGIAIVKSPNPDFIARASAIPGVKSIIHGLNMNWLPPGEKAIENITQEAEPVLTPGDTRYPIQWNMPAIHADAAWYKGYKGNGALVAILDGGFYPAHPDIAANVNLALSTNFVAGETIDMTGGGFSHGTHVAGIVASGINGIGTVGVAPEATLMLVKVLSNSGSGNFEDLISGIYYAASNGADVINMSLGGYIPHHETIVLEDGSKINITNELQDLLTAMNRATNFANQKGTLLIAAAGNDGIDLQKIADYDHYPAGCAQVLSVSATAPEGWAIDMSTNPDLPASYTNYGGGEIDFAGPGGDFDLSSNANCTVAGLTRACWIFDMVNSPGSPTGYFWAAGTSMASPHVAGVAALIVGKHPDYTTAQVEAALKASVDDLGKPGRDEYFGWGRVNASKAVEQ
jgi:subtilisin family serine protease